MSVVTAESRVEAEVPQQPRGKARFWNCEAPLAYLSMSDKAVGFADIRLVRFETFQLLLSDRFQVELRVIGDEAVLLLDV